MWIVLTFSKRFSKPLANLVPVGIREVQSFMNILLLAKLNVRKRSLLEETVVLGGKGGCWVGLSPKVQTEKNCSLVKFEKIQPSFASYQTPKKYIRICSSMTIFLDRFHYMLKESSCQEKEGLIINNSFKEKMSQKI